jgi:hypothetical protein
MPFYLSSDIASKILSHTRTLISNDLFFSGHKQVDTMVEMTQALATTNGVNSSIAIGVSLSSLEGNISVCRGVAETVPAETFIVNAMKQKRKVNVI